MSKKINPPEFDKATIITIPTDLHQRLRIKALKEGTTISMIIVKALRKEMK